MPKNDDEYGREPMAQLCRKCLEGKHPFDPHDGCDCDCWMFFAKDEPEPPKAKCTHDPLWSAPGFCVICRSTA